MCNSGFLPLSATEADVPRTPVRVVAADLALVFDAQTVQLPQPVGDGLAVPAQRQVERIVNRLLLIIRLLVSHTTVQRQESLWHRPQGHRQGACADVTRQHNKDKDNRHVPPLLSPRWARPRSPYLRYRPPVPHTCSPIPSEEIPRNSRAIDR